MVKGFARSTQGVGQQTNEGFKYLNPFLSTSRRTFSELTRDTPALEQLIVDGSQLSGALASRRDDISALIGNLNTMMGALANQRTALAESINALPPFMRDFNTTSVNLRAALDDVDPLVDASKPVAVRLRPFFANFRAAAADLVPTIRDLDEIVSDPGKDDDLVDLTRLQPNLAKIAIGPYRDNGAAASGVVPGEHHRPAGLAQRARLLPRLPAGADRLVQRLRFFRGSATPTAASAVSAPPSTPSALAANGLPIVDLAGAHADHRAPTSSTSATTGAAREPTSAPPPTARTRSPTRTTRRLTAARSTAIRRWSRRASSPNWQWAGFVQYLGVIRPADARIAALS